MGNGIYQKIKPDETCIYYLKGIINVEDLVVTVKNYTELKNKIIKPITELFLHAIKHLEQIVGQLSLAQSGQKRRVQH